MIKRLLLVDGVEVVCLFRDDGAFVEGYGLMESRDMERLCAFAHDYRRMVQGNADQLAMFSQLRGWTPPRGLVLRGAGKLVCCVGNIVVAGDVSDTDVNDLIVEMVEVAHW
jgi:roadblock/LC7 domain-containing protein